MAIKVIITGATGMVGEGVLLECLEHPDVKKIQIVGRKHYDLDHPKLKQFIVPDFFGLNESEADLSGYNACFFCAGVSSVGMNEADYTRVTYDMTLHFARIIATLNPGMVLTYISGQATDSSEKGRVMWARVKGKTENALMQLPFKSVYNFRPGIIKSLPGQQNIKSIFKVVDFLYPVLHTLFPNYSGTLKDVATAMIKCVQIGYPKNILEVRDINSLANG